MPERPPPLRIFVVDDSTAVRERVKALVGDVADAKVCGEASSARAAFEMIPQVEPELLILDLSLPDASGFEILEMVKKHMPGIVVIVYSMFTLKQARNEGMTVEADYVFKKDDPEEKLIDVIGALSLTRELLRAHQRQMRIGAVALSAVPGAIVVTDPKGVIHWVNGAFEHHTGYTAEEAVGRNIKLISSGKHDRAFYDDFWATLRAGKAWQGEFINRRKDGLLYSEEQLVTPILNHVGQCTHFVSIKREALQTQFLEATAVERREILKHASDGIVMFDLEGRVQVWNEAAHRIFGLSIVEVQGKPMRSLLTRSSVPKFDAGLDAVLKRCEPWSAELQVDRKADHRVVLVEMRLSPVLGEDGLAKGWLGLCTERGLSAGGMGHALHSPGADPGQLRSAAVMHDMQATLSGMQEALSKALDPASDADPEAVLRGTLSEVSGIQESVGRSLHWLGRELDAFAPVDLAVLVDETQGLLHSRLPKQVELKVEVTSSLPPAMGESRLLQQAILNLVTNACDAMPTGGILGIRVAPTRVEKAMLASMPGAQPGDYLRIIISDTGVGMSPEQLERIWKAFYSTKGNCGLGLTAVRWIMHAHGGFAWIGSRLGKGTQCALHLPLASLGASASS